MICWSGDFTRQALANSLPETAPHEWPLLDLQEMITSVEDYLMPTRPPYPTNLNWLRILYGFAEPDKTSALNVAQTTRLVTNLLLGPCS